MSKKTARVVERRSFLNGALTGAAPLAALAVGGAAIASAQTAKTTWQPVRHAQDDWMDEVGTVQHRLALDTTNTESFTEGLAFASNYVNVNQSAYGVENSSLAVILIARHRSTPFAFNDAFWKKYGEALTKLTNFPDPKTKQAPVLNVFNAKGYSELGTRGVTLDTLIQMGVRFGVCGMASRGIADIIASGAGVSADDVYKEIEANLIPNARIVPAGIVAISRAQERGYTLVTC